MIPHIPTNVVLQYQRIISPTTINEAKFGINRANYHNWGYGTSPVAVTFRDSTASATPRSIPKSAPRFPISIT